MYVDMFSCYTILLFQRFNDKFSTTSSVILMTRKDEEDQKKSLDKSCNHRGLEKFLNDSVILRIWGFFWFFFLDLAQRNLRTAGGRGEFTAAREAPSVGRQLWEQKPAKNTHPAEGDDPAVLIHTHTHFSFHADTHSTALPHRYNVVCGFMSRLWQRCPLPFIVPPL